MSSTFLFLFVLSQGKFNSTRLIIPKKVPTDDGMCCAFNRKTADKIFVDSAYPQTLKELNDDDRDLAFDRPVKTPGKFVLWCVSGIRTNLK